MFKTNALQLMIHCKLKNSFAHFRNANVEMIDTEGKSLSAMKTFHQQVAGFEQ